MQKIFRKKTVLLCLLLFFLQDFSMLVINAEISTTKSIVLGSGAVYTGEMALGKSPHGKGEVTWKDGSKYKGEVFNGMLHGKGVFNYYNGDKYEGEFAYGFRSGSGKMVFSNGDMYVGEWQADMMHGKGKYTFHSSGESKKNDYYSGQWCYNMMHGKGTYVFANGKSKNGYWVKNAYKGEKLTKQIETEIGELK